MRTFECLFFPQKKSNFMCAFTFGLHASFMEDRFGLPVDDNAIAEQFFPASRILLYIMSGD